MPVDPVSGAVVAGAVDSALNAIQGLDSLTELMGVADGCSYNLHGFKVVAAKNEGPETSVVAPPKDANRRLRPQAKRSASEPESTGAVGTSAKHGENDPLQVAPQTPAGPPPPNSNDESTATANSAMGRGNQPRRQVTPILYFRVYRRSFEAEAVFGIDSVFDGNTASCMVQLTTLTGFDTKLFNQVSVEFDSTEIPSGTLLLVKGLFNPYGLGYVHFSGRYLITLDLSGPRLSVLASGLALAGNLNSITQLRIGEGAVVLESAGGSHVHDVGHP